MRIETSSALFSGVEKSFAVQAGREVRILVRPEEIAARRGLPLEDVAPAAMLRARAGAGA